jgi:ribosome-associated toxin RatA of RatAB toxin-antitoxin module
VRRESRSLLVSWNRLVIEIRRSALVPYSAERIFDLINDIEAYPSRFAWCAGAQILAREPNALIARLDVRVAGFTQSFTTRNTLDRPSRIALSLVEGPFRALSGEWVLTALGDNGCKIALALDFDYAGRLMAPIMRSGFEILADRLVDEFCREAHRLYG